MLCGYFLYAQGGRRCRFQVHTQALGLVEYFCFRRLIKIGRRQSHGGALNCARGGNWLRGRWLQRRTYLSLRMRAIGDRRTRRDCFFLGIFRNSSVWLFISQPVYGSTSNDKSSRRFVDLVEMHDFLLIDLVARELTSDEDTEHSFQFFLLVVWRCLQLGMG